MRFAPAIKLAIHPRFTAFVGGQRVAPINVEISPVHVCNAQCPWCFYAGTHGKLGPDTTIDAGRMRSALSEMRWCGVQAVTWTGGGEPTLHPEFQSFVGRAQREGLEQGLFTNGLRMPNYDVSAMAWVRVSNTNRPWNRDVLVALRRHAMALGLCVNYTGPEMYATLDEALTLADDLGLDYVQCRPALGLRGSSNYVQPPLRQHPRLIVTDYKFHDQGQPHGYERCYGFHFVPFVWHNGDVDVCAYHRGNGRYTLGNLHSNRFVEIMDAAPASVPVCDTCQVCCKNHEINKLVNQAVAVEDRAFV